MDTGQLVLLVLSGALTMFTLGASVAWRLEGRRPLVPPLWLVVARNLSLLVWALYILVALDTPSGIDPFWWIFLKTVPFIATLVSFPIEVREVLRRRETT